MDGPLYDMTHYRDMQIGIFSDIIIIPIGLFVLSVIR